MPTFRIQTLGCKVNQYESLQMQQLLCDLGWEPARGEQADLVIVNTCAVTTNAAGKSRQFARKAAARGCGKTLIAGCWATSDGEAAKALPGGCAVAGHGDDLAVALRELTAEFASQAPADTPAAAHLSSDQKGVGAAGLPLLSRRQATNQRAILKVQDGCDAGCTYCIVPHLRQRLSSKPLADAVEEARRLVAVGHVEIVLSGVFLGAYGQGTALHRRQRPSELSLSRLVEALCTRVPGLERLRLSSLEPADLTHELIGTLSGHAQVMPHFHLPLQSGSDEILRRMNRQYTSSDYLAMVHRLRRAFAQPALTTDIITGFPGETEREFARTLEVVDEAAFIHIHAFPYSPRPGTAAAGWRQGRVPQRVANERRGMLERRAEEHSLAFRRGFVGQTVQVLVEPAEPAEPRGAAVPLRYGRCERYFTVHFDPGQREIPAGACLDVRIEAATVAQTLGRLV